MSCLLQTALNEAVNKACYRMDCRFILPESCSWQVLGITELLKERAGLHNAT